MKILIVGGTGLVGGQSALHLSSLGHEITIMARKESSLPALAEFDFIQADYMNHSLSAEQLSRFDAMVFAAAADIRHIPMDGSVTPDEFYKQANDVAVPGFFALAKQAGISNAVYIGTFYPQVAPEKIGVCPYVTSRHNADEAVRALADESFRVCSLNAPFVLGHLPGLEVPHLDALIQYAKGQLEGLPIFAPEGGTNHISAHSLSQAVANALENGEPGKAYLVGDENYTWKEYLELWFSAVGNSQDIEVKSDDHPMLPNIIMFAGVGATVSYQPDSSDLAILNYDLNQISSLVKEIVEARG